MGGRFWHILVLFILIFLLPTQIAFAASSAQHAQEWDDYSAESQWANDKWIDINLSEQWLTAYNGHTPVFGTSVSTGIDGYDTPTGDFAIVYKQEWQTMSGEGYYLEDVPYVMYFADYLAIHGTYWHDNFGQRMSHGCVNLPTWAAAWLYDWARIGTPVTIHY